jgi:HEAT repeat protein
MRIALLSIALLLLTAHAARADERIDRLIRQFSASRFQEREQAQKELVALGPPALAPLRKAAQSSDPEVARRAGECVAAIEHNAQVATLVAALNKERGHARGQVARKLGKLGPTAHEAVPALIEAIDDEDWYAGHMAIDALGRIGPAARQAVPRLIDVVKGPAQNGLPLCAARALGNIGPAAQPAVPALFQALDSKSPKLRARAAEALGSVGGTDKNLVRALQKALLDPDSEVRYSAAAAIGKLGKEPTVAVPALCDALGRNEFPAVDQDAPGSESPRGIVIRALGSFGPEAKEAVPALVKLLENGNQPNCVYLEAIDALGRIGPGAKDAIPVLSRLAKGALYSDEALRALEAIQLNKP